MKIICKCKKGDFTSPANQPCQNLEKQRFLNIKKPKGPNQEHKNTL